MPLTSIWERYFLREMGKCFLLFLLSFYALYVLIDYSNHSHSFQHYRFSFFELMRYYGHEFVVRMNVLVPFALLISCVKTLCSLNMHHELIALMASGIRLKRLLFPFIAFSLFFTGLIYLNGEIFQPNAMKYHEQLDHQRARVKKTKYHYPHIQQLMLKDGSSLIFQRYDPLAHEFFDLYWVRSIDDIYRIRDLKLQDAGAVGLGVEHLQRDPEGALKLTERFDQKQLPDLLFDQHALSESAATPEVLSLSQMHKKLADFEAILSEKDARLVTAYYYKLAIPWLCLLAVLAPAPFCISYTRTLPIFFIYALSLFGLVGFYLIMNAAVVLGERQVIDPALAIWCPFCLFFTFFALRFYRKT
jgi:lipopolysaccharide export system permease protein